MLQPIGVAMTAEVVTSELVSTETYRSGNLNRFQHLHPNSRRSLH